MNKKILVVEDSPEICELLEEEIASFSGNYKVKTAENGKIAKEMISIQDFDLIISDIQMPFFDWHRTSGVGQKV